MKIFLGIAALMIFTSDNVCFGQTGTFAVGMIRVNKGHVKQGDNLTITCHMKAVRPGGYVLQIYKAAMESVFPSGEYKMNEEVEYVINNNTDLDPAYEQTNRYTAGVYIKDKLTRLTLNVTDIQPEDSGRFGCRAYYTDEGFPSPSSTLLNVNVTGPIRTVELLYPAIKPDHVWSWLSGPGNAPTNEPDQSPLSVLSGSSVEIGCKVTLSNNPEWPVVQAFLGNKEVTDISRSENGDIKGFYRPGYLLDSYVNTYYFWKMALSLADHGKNLTCTAQLPSMFTTPVSTWRLLNVTGAPETGKCDPSYIFAPLGTLDLQVSCTAHAHETPDLSVTWFGPGNMGKLGSSTDQLSDFSLEWKGLTVNSTFTLPNVTQHGIYHIVWSNQHGKTSAELEIGNQVSGVNRLKASVNVYLGVLLVFIMVVFHMDHHLT